MFGNDLRDSTLDTIWRINKIRGDRLKNGRFRDGSWGDEESAGRGGFRLPPRPTGRRLGLAVSGIMHAVSSSRGDTAVTTPHGATLTMATLSSPDPSALARFYARLLGWEIETEKPGWVTLRNPADGVRLGFHVEDVYTPPVWPSRPGEQLMMAHLEIRVDNLAAGCDHARACGATLAAVQPQEDVRVHLDPDGHPFCLYLDA